MAAVATVVVCRKSRRESERGDFFGVLMLTLCLDGLFIPRPNLLDPRILHAVFFFGSYCRLTVRLVFVSFTR